MLQDKVKKLIRIINNWNIEKIEAFYLFMKCYWRYWLMCLKIGPGRYTYRADIERQLELRGFPESFKEFEKICRFYDLKDEETDAITNYIEDVYKERLEKFIRRKIETVSYTHLTLPTN